MKWLDLQPYGLRLSAGRARGSMEPAFRVTGTGTALGAHGPTLDSLGFQASPDGRTWWNRTAVLDKAMWGALRAAFPRSEIADIPAAQAFDDGTHRQVTFTRVGEHRGRKRLWMEGLRLADCGFQPGERYTVMLDTDARRIILALAADGERQVSHRTRQRGGEPTQLPIIDLATEELTDVIGDAGRMRATLYRGRIEFDLHPVDRAVEEREARIRAHVGSGHVTEGTLCAGGGVSTLALSQGFEAAEIQSTVEWVVDRERAYLQSAVDNVPVVGPETTIYEASLEEVTGSSLLPVDVMQVSLPCTGHSASGKAKRGLKRAEHHPTDALAVFGLIRIIDAVQPAIVISENVTPARDSATYDLILGYLREQGYVVAERVMNEQDAGSLERRERWWFVAMSRGLAEGFTLDNMAQRPRAHERLGEILEPVPDDSDEWTRNNYLDDKAVRDSAAGKGFRRQFVNPDSPSVGTIGRGYRKRRSTEPFLQRADGMERLLTPIEHARVKGIPEEIVRDLSKTLADEILGQSILFGHAEAIAEHVGRHLRRVVDPHVLDGARETVVEQAIGPSVSQKPALLAMR